MSFSSEIKERLCAIELTCPKCAVAEIAGMLRMSWHTSDGIRIVTENKEVASRAARNMEEGFGIKINQPSEKRNITITVDDEFENENIKAMIFTDPAPFECCKASYVRGAFLGCGSVSDPNKNYHLEFCVKSVSEAKSLAALLSEKGFSPKVTERKGAHIVYLKGFEDIADLLGYIGAPKAALELFTVQVEKEMRNNINRRVNCENANAEKLAKAASKHIAAVKKIKYAGQWDKLSDTLKAIGDLRCEYPEDSLKELGERLDPTIGKSGVNHRLNRILSFADTL